MPRKIDGSKPSRAMVKGNVSRLVKPEQRSVRDAAEARTQYQDARWRRARAYLMDLHQWRCMYALWDCEGDAKVLDHYVPVSLKGDFFEPSNLLPACKRCHTYLTNTYDAIGGTHGRTRPGKPDPRTPDYYQLIDAVRSQYAIAIRVKRRKAGHKFDVKKADPEQEFFC